MRDYAKDERILRRQAAGIVDWVAGSGPCPGWKRPCGVSTPRDLCYYCTRSQAIEKEDK